MESLFYVYFRKWCSRASQIAFHDCQKIAKSCIFKNCSFGQHQSTSYSSSLTTSGAMARKSSNRVSWDSFCLIGSRYQHNITSGNILLSDHCSLGHLFVGPPPTTHQASGEPTKNMCLRKSVSIIICPSPLSHHTLHYYLQSRYSTKGWDSWVWEVT